MKAGVEDSHKSESDELYKIQSDPNTTTAQYENARKQMQELREGLAPSKTRKSKKLSVSTTGRLSRNSATTFGPCSKSDPMVPPRR